MAESREVHPSGARPGRPAPSAADEAYDIRIARDGTWFHEGTPIGRPGLVRLFASVLRRDEAGDYWLVTPAERGRIIVEDVPFFAVAASFEGGGRGQRIIFRTSLDETVTAGPTRPIRLAFDPETGEPSPYVEVRDGLEARIARAVFYDLAERAVEVEGRMGVWSGGAFFPLDAPPGPAAAAAPGTGDPPKG